MFWRYLSIWHFSTLISNGLVQTISLTFTYKFQYYLAQILDWSKLKAFTDDSLYVAQMMIYFFDRVEKIVGKGENAGYQHFLLFPQCFQIKCSDKQTG